MLADIKGKFLFEIRPDLFPEGFLTNTEVELWGIYFDSKKIRKESLKGRK